jgi:hypothetical protein
MTKFRIAAALAALLLAAAATSSWAQMAPVHGWPPRSYWTTGLFQEGAISYCEVFTSDYPANTLQFRLVQFAPKAGSPPGVQILSTKASRSIPAPEIKFASDGFAVMAVPAQSQFDRMLTGVMGNVATAKLDPDQWEKLWQVFRHSGVVTVDTAFIESHMPTEGFEQASADFEQCLAQLDLVAPAPAPNSGWPE